LTRARSRKGFRLLGRCHGGGKKWSGGAISGWHGGGCSGERAVTHSQRDFGNTNVPNHPNRYALGTNFSVTKFSAHVRKPKVGVGRPRPGGRPQPGGWCPARVPLVMRCHAVATLTRSASCLLRAATLASAPPWCVDWPGGGMVHHVNVLAPLARSVLARSTSSERVNSASARALSGGAFVRPAPMLP
jgi:hypothetical protein